MQHRLVVYFHFSSIFSKKLFFCNQGIHPTTKRIQWYEYLGCYQDGRNRQLEKEQYSRKSNTPEKCGSECRDAGFTYFGMQARPRTLCFCGHKLAHDIKLDEEKCKSKCSGDSSKICGGLWKNSLYLIKKEKDGKCIVHL